MGYTVRNRGPWFNTLWALAGAGSALYNWAVNGRSKKTVQVVKGEQQPEAVQNASRAFEQSFGPLAIRGAVGESVQQNIEMPLAMKNLAGKKDEISGLPVPQKENTENQKSLVRRISRVIPLLALPFFARAGASAAGANEAGSAGEGVFSSMYTGAKEAFGYAWSHLGWATKVGVGITAAAGIAYLIHKYWKSSGINITNTNTNTNTVNLNIEGKPGMKVVKTEKDGQVTYAIENTELQETLNQLINEIRAQKAAAAA